MAHHMQHKYHYIKVCASRAYLGSREATQKANLLLVMNSFDISLFSDKQTECQLVIMSELRMLKIDTEYTYNVIEDLTITETSTQVIDKIGSILHDWPFNSSCGKPRSIPIRYFYIGKTYIEARHRTFNPYDPRTWSKKGITDRRKDHEKKFYGNGGFVIVAVVTEESIPITCKEDGYITDQEEYALTLEKRLIAYYRGSEKLSNKSDHPGQTTKDMKQAYVIYIAFSFGKLSELDFNM